LDRVNKQVCCLCQSKNNNLKHIQRTCPFCKNVNRLYFHLSCIHEKMDICFTHCIDSQTNQYQIRKLNTNDKIEIFQKIKHETQIQTKYHETLFGTHSNTNSSGSFIKNTHTIEANDGFGLFVNNNIVSFVSHGQPITTKNNNRRVYIELIQTFEPHQSKGYASTLLTHLESHFRNDCDYVWLFPVDKSIEFWFNRGYNHCGENVFDDLEEFNFVKHLKKINI